MRLPKIDDPLLWADWLELSALLNADQSASRGDLEGALRLSGYVIGHEDVQNRCNETFAELIDRSKSAEAAYPFDLSAALIACRPQLEQYAPYLFCLFLSYAGWSKKKGEGQRAARLFEDLACFAARAYIGGEYARFAYPRKGSKAGLPKAFKAAIAELANRLCEGEGCHNKPTRSAKDDAVDVVAWRHFPDRRPGKLVLMGQCASGNDWHKKLTDLVPRATMDEWLLRPLISEVVRAIFIPHRAAKKDWEHICRRAGVVFDRCRLAHWAHHASAEEMQPLYSWATNRLDGVKA